MKITCICFIYSFILTIVSSSYAQYLFVSDYDWNHSIARSALNGSEYTKILTETSGYIGEIAVDNINKTLYYIGGYKIKQCSFDGSNQITLLNPTHEPGGLAISNEKMFWTEVNTIWRANLDGSSKEIIVSDLGNCFSLAYDDVHKNLYYIGYTDSSCRYGAIYRVNPDGTNSEILVNNIGLSVGLAVDPYNNKIYWADRGTPFNSIKTANLDGTSVTDLITGQQNPLVDIVQHLDIDLYNQKLYWTDQSGGGKAQRMNVDGTGYEVIHYDNAPYGIAIAIPEPGTVGLMLLGGLAAGRRRKMKEIR